MKERGEGREEEKAGGRKLGGGGEGRKEGRKTEGRNNKRRKRQTGETDRETWLDYPRKHTQIGIWSHTELAQVALGIGTLELDLSSKYLNFNFSSYKMRILTSNHCKLIGD